MALQLDISREAFSCLSEGASRDLKLQAASGKLPLDAGDLGALLLYLSHDPDQEVSVTAIGSLRELTGDRLRSVIEAPETHPFLLDVLSRLHVTEPEILELIALQPSVSPETLEFLSLHGVQVATELYVVATVLDEVPEGTGEAPEDDDAELDEEEFRSKYQLAQSMGVAEKIKMALTGDKEWRGILIKDSNKLVSGSVVKNPRITDSEVLTIAKSAIQNDEIMRVICSNKEWIKNYNIRKALVENSKTPLPHALRYMASLSEKDLSSLAKSKNVSSVISTQARRLISNKKK